MYHQTKEVIQRVQSIYMLLAGLVAGVLPLWLSFFTVDSTSPIGLLETFMFDSVLVKSIGILFVISALMSLGTILQFKKRPHQILLNKINILINVYLLSVLVYLSLVLPGEMQISEKGIGMCFPAIIIVLLVIANKAIKKDEDLVKSVDRLR